MEVVVGDRRRRFGNGLSELPDRGVGLAQLEVDVAQGIDGGDILSRSFGRHSGQGESPVEVASQTCQKVSEVIFHKEKIAPPVEGLLVEFEGTDGFSDP